MMKKITMSLCAVLFAATSFAQSAKFTEAMKKTLAEFDSIATAEQCIALSNKFERIASAEKSEWLPYYYAALTRVTSVFLSQDVSTIDANMDAAQALTDKADSLMPNNSEIVLLKSMVLSGRMMVDPMTRGAQYGMQINLLIQKAMQLDPSNPRAYYMMGQGLFYTPPQYGGGADKGCAMLVQAKEKYQTFKPASPLHPKWGEEQVDQILTQCGGADSKPVQQDK